MEELRKLEQLSLVSKICTELENHLGLNDKDVAEFIIDLADKNGTFDKFKTALLNLEGLGNLFDDSFISNLWRLIQHMQPNKKPAAKSTNALHLGEIDHESEHYMSEINYTTKDELRKVLPALAIPDEKTAEGTKDLMAQLEGLFPVVYKLFFSRHLY